MCHALHLFFIKLVLIYVQPNKLLESYVYHYHTLILVLQAKQSYAFHSYSYVFYTIHAQYPCCYFYFIFHTRYPCFHSCLVMLYTLDDKKWIMKCPCLFKFIHVLRIRWTYVDILFIPTFQFSNKL